MAVKFNSSGGGSVLLDAPSTASNLTVTLPSASGTLVSTGSPFSGGTANGVVYLNGSSVPTTGSALTFSGTNFKNTSGYVSANTDFRLTDASFSRVAVADGGGGFVGGYNITYSGSPVYDSTGATSGIYYYAGGSIQFYAGGSAAAGTAAPEQMRLTSTGLGIGTSSPVGRLSAIGSDNSTQAVFSGSIGGTGRGLRIATSLIASNNEGAILDAQATTGSATLIFQTASTERMRLNYSGNLGLGVTPSAVVSDFKGIEVGSPGNGVFGGTGNYSHIILSDNAYPSAGSVACSYGFSGYAGQYRINSGYHYWLSAPSGTAGGAITFTTILTGTKDQTLALQGASSQSGTGITFPATQSASSDANTLDDYEEGTWTPVLKSGSNTISYSGGTNVFRYTKIGNLVTLTFQIDGAVTSGTTGGNFSIQGIPFMANVRVTGTRMFWWDSGLLLSNANVSSHINNGNVQIDPYYKDTYNGQYATPTVSSVGSSSYLFFEISYQTT